MEYAELELSLYRHDTNSYRVEIRFTSSGSEADVRPLAQAPEVEFDFAALRALQLDPVAYGQRLSQSLFIDPVWQAFDKARVSAQTTGSTLRVRLTIDSHAPELHGLYWETLRTPPGEALFNGERVLFSRYLSSLDWRPVRLQPRGQVRALAVIANPANLGHYKLQPVDVAQELRRAQAALNDIPLTTLAGAGQATLPNLLTQLRQGYDVVYLACHGTLLNDEPWLWLEDEAGQAHRVKGSEWVAHLRELPNPPRLVVLASCQSAAAGQGGSLTALGPRLAEAGVPAVIAMQGNIRMATAETFMPAFFAELSKDGQIDRAFAVARGAIQQQPDSWMPALFMRLKSGRLWYAPGFADDPRGLKKWPALVNNIREQQCTPLLGPGLLEALLGSRRELAWRWARDHHYPLAPHEREDLPHVAQYLAVEQDAMYPRSQLADFLRQSLLERYGALMAAGETAGDPSLIQLLSTVGQHLRQQNPAEPHRLLASLPFSLYLTANPDDLLYEALVAEGKRPRVQVCRWNSAARKLPAPVDDPAYQASCDEPLVFYLFGRLQHPRTLVLTEDDYDDYLIEVSRNPKSIPVVVRDALASTALLFMGFQIGDRPFRTLFRTIRNQEGSGQLDDYAHVTAQLDPEEGRTLEPRRARDYIEGYFQMTHTSLFWGTVDDFAAQLHQRWTAGD